MASSIPIEKKKYKQNCLTNFNCFKLRNRTSTIEAWCEGKLSQTFLSMLFTKGNDKAKCIALNFSSSSSS